MSKRLAVFLLGLLVLAGCTPETTSEPTEQKLTDELALAFERYVHRYYETRLAGERGTPAPSLAARLRAREDLKEALHALGRDLESGNTLAGAFASVKDALVARDYIFLPLSQSGETADEELGIAFAHVRRREAARSLELWGKKVEFKLVVYEPLVYDYPTWKARVLKVEGPMYSPGRFSATRQTIYIDHDYCVKRAQAQPLETQSLGLDGILHEVELRQAAYLLFGGATSDPAVLERVHEKVLWTAVRYGDPDLAWIDVNGLATDARYPKELRDAAQRVRAKLPITLAPYGTKDVKAEALRRIAEEAWKTLG